MDKIDCIEDYFAATRAYYLYFIGRFSNDFELMNYILDKKYLTGAKLSMISNIMLGIKEDLVDNLGYLDYRTKLFSNELEKAVDQIADKVTEGYKVGNYVFSDAATLVALLRNKLAHGNYKIDFDHNRVIINHRGTDIIFNIDKIINFIAVAFDKTIFFVKKNVYQRDVLIKKNNFRTKRMENIQEVKSLIKEFQHLQFSLESLDDSVIGLDCIQLLENFLHYYKENHTTALKDDYYRRVNNYFSKRNCKFSYKIRNLHNSKDRDAILEFSSNEVLKNPDLNYSQQEMIIGREIQRKMNDEYNNFNPIFANFNNLYLLNAISRTNSVKLEDLSSYIDNVFGRDLIIGIDEFGMVLLSMFNSLFLYPFDDVYDVDGGYQLNRSNNFDFSSLDLSMLEPTVININEYSKEFAKSVCDSLLNRCQELSNRIKIQQANLEKVSGNVKAENNINANIGQLQSDLSIINSRYSVALEEYKNICDDFDNNGMYFRNKAIIEGIRNSIAHGNYEFITQGHFSETLIVFNDIYEGELTFQLKVKFSEFSQFIEENYMNVLNYINGYKNRGSKK